MDFYLPPPQFFKHVQLRWVWKEEPCFLYFPIPVNHQSYATQHDPLSVPFVYPEMFFALHLLFSIW